MRVKVLHNTQYQYMERVFLEPHLLRLTPRRDDHIRVVSRSVQISPDPAGMNTVLENDGSVATLVWFKGMTSVLEIRAEAVLETGPFNPFNFLIYPSSCLRLPMRYPEPWPGLLGPYLRITDENPDIRAFALGLAEAGQYETVSFLTGLARVIHEDFDYKVRYQGPAHQPSATLKEKRGACRDFVVLAMAACRHLGLACRYVSGYYLSDESSGPDELHAWLEVFLPGAGWTGIDPSHGIVCDHHFIPLCASADPATTLPVTGSFRGFSSSHMKVDLSIQVTS